MNKLSSTSLRMSAHRGYIGVLMVFGLMAITLYMAFAFPYTLFHLKQTETTEIKSVIIVGRGGEKSPRPESYFIGEEPPEELHTLGYEQLTNAGKERMYLLGKFLKLRYYHLLLNGDPRAIYVRSSDTDRSLESSQALMAGLNPPKEPWLWSSTGELANWQPKAVHTTSASSDDLLSAESNCLRLEQDKLRWKNSTRYQQLLNEFRHDLQTLRSNTGLEFEDDLEMLSQIEDALKTRKAYKDKTVPAWYTNTFANRLAHIADVTSESHYSSPGVQRLFVGRLLHEITQNIDTKIRQQTMASGESSSSRTVDLNDEIDDRDDRRPGLKQQQQQSEQQQQEPKQQPARLSSKPKGGGAFSQREPNMFVYLTDKQRLSALLNSLQIYSSQPQFGSLLIIELHYDPINQLHFLRLFTVSSSSPNVFPEPLRVNPIACVDSVECAPQQFEQNIRHLMLDRDSWQEVCTDRNSAPTPGPNEIVPPKPSASSHDDDNWQLQEVTTAADTQADVQPNDLLPGGSTTMSPMNLDKLEDNLIVGPTDARPSPDDEHKEQEAAILQGNATAPGSSEPPPGTDSVVAPTMLANSSESSTAVVAEDKGDKLTVVLTTAKPPTASTSDDTTDASGGQAIAVPPPPAASVEVIDNNLIDGSPPSELDEPTRNKPQRYQPESSSHQLSWE